MNMEIKARDLIAAGWHEAAASARLCVALATWSRRVCRALTC